METSLVLGHAALASVDNNEVPAPAAIAEAAASVPVDLVRNSRRDKSFSVSSGSGFTVVGFSAGCFTGLSSLVHFGIVTFRSKIERFTVVFLSFYANSDRPLHGLKMVQAHISDDADGVGPGPRGKVSTLQCL